MTAARDVAYRADVSPAPSELAFDRYVIEALIGEGGMGRVYRARDDRLQRSVALKLLRPDRAEGEAGARLLREARAAAALDHPNTVAVYDVGETGGTPFIAMELVAGRSLRAMVGDASVPVERRLRYLVDVARALQAAHDRGILHRDVKPENVLVRRDDVVKVVDFGIAHPLDLPPSAIAPGTPDAAARARFESWTQSGLVGTPRYMAPEQLHGDRLDARTDQFAWGVLAYELLAGVSPWDETGDARSLTLVSSIVDDAPPSFEALARLVSPEVVEVVARALAKRPGDRFESMAAVATALAPPPSIVARTRRFRPLAPGIEARGELVAAVIEAFGPFATAARKYIPEVGLGPDGRIAPGSWIRQADWMLAFEAMIAEVGAAVLFNIGQSIPAHADGWATTAPDIAQELATLDVVYHLQHRKHGRPMFDETTGAMTEGIGHYLFRQDDPAVKRATVECTNPYPCELDHGILTAIVRRGGGEARVDHVPARCRTLGAASCVYLVEWA